MNSSTKGLQDQQQSHEDQIVYVNDNKIPAQDGQVIHERRDEKAVEVKGPPLKDNQPRKKKPTPSGFYFSISLYLVTIKHFILNRKYLGIIFISLGGDKGGSGDQGGNGHGVLLPPQEPNGPGEMGKPVVLPKELTPEQKKLVDDGWQKNAFNQYVSDMISVHRALPDPRDDK